MKLQPNQHNGLMIISSLVTCNSVLIVGGSTGYGIWLNNTVGIIGSGNGCAGGGTSVVLMSSDNSLTVRF